MTCQMAGDASDDVTVASILARLQEVSSRGEPAEKLYRLAQALESKPSRDRQGVLRHLCSKTEWNMDRQPTRSVARELSTQLSPQLSPELSPTVVSTR